MTPRVSALLSAIERTTKSLSEATTFDHDSEQYPEHVPNPYDATFRETDKFISHLKQNPALSGHADVLDKLQDAAVKRMAGGGELYRIARDAYLTHFAGISDHVRALKERNYNYKPEHNTKLYSKATADAILALLGKP